MTNRKILDPICDMIVDLDEAGTDGLTVEHAGRDYGFCSSGCRQRFSKDPSRYVLKIDEWLAKGSGATEHVHGATAALPAIDAGIRAWYEACRCCLSDAHPQLVDVLDRERAATAQAHADTAICETAESDNA